MNEIRQRLKACWYILLGRPVCTFKQSEDDGLSHACICGCDARQHLGGFGAGYYCNGPCNPRCTGYKEAKP